MTLVLGVDPSAKKIAFVARETLLDVHKVGAFLLYKGSSRQTPETMLAAMEATRGFLDSIRGLSAGPCAAWVEVPLVGRGGVQTAIKQAYVGGVIRGCLVEAGFTVYDVHQSTWKAALGVPGGRQGTTAKAKAGAAEVVRTRWYKVWSQVEGDDDLTDAAAIALYGAEQVRKAGVLGAAGLAESTVQRRRR